MNLLRCCKNKKGRIYQSKKDKSYGEVNSINNFVDFRQELIKDKTAEEEQLVKSRYGSTRPKEDMDRLIWIDLRRMFKHDPLDDIWRHQHNSHLLHWILYDSCGVYHLVMKHMIVYLLVEKKYPLSQATLTMMLNEKLKVDHECEMTYELFREVNSINNFVDFRQELIKDKTAEEEQVQETSKRAREELLQESSSKRKGPTNKTHREILMLSNQLASMQMTQQIPYTIHNALNESLGWTEWVQTHLGWTEWRKEGISGLLKYTSAIRQLAYGVHAEFLDEYMQISERSSRLALDHFCESVMQIYGPEYLRKPTVTDVEEKHEFPGMLGSLDSVASQDLWIWHSFFGVAGSNNGINVLYQSPLFNDLKTGREPEIPFVANGITYPSGYYLVDGIYPKLAPLVKTIPELADDDHKRILYKQKQESARKDVERAFGVLKKKWVILANPTRALKKERIINMMYTCIILHNMI
ncbi:ALP1-like protein [Tanacetum coccineum]